MTCYWKCIQKPTQTRCKRSAVDAPTHGALALRPVHHHVHQKLPEAVYYAERAQASHEERAVDAPLHRFSKKM